MPEVITNHLDLWTSALLTKSTAGRGKNGKLEAYGIGKLRELILELAVRGKLVAQDPKDEPANVLLEKITKEKARLIKVGEIKKVKSLPDIGDDEKQFALPHGWEWSRLQSVSSYIQRGKGPQYADYGKVRVVSQKCIQWAGFDLTQARYVDDASLDDYQPERFLKNNDLLWNSTGTGTVGRINVVPAVAANSLVADSHVTIIRPLLMNSNFMRCYVAAPGVQQRIEPEHENPLVSGTTNQVELNTGAVTTLVVPVPPLAEQHRIVAKVDELMALCNQLEQQQTHSIEAHQTLVDTLLGMLTRVVSQQELTEVWSRIARHFDTLFTTERSIDQLKQTILQLAVMGKLVPQDPNDEPASELLKCIQAEKAKLIAEGNIKQDKPLPEISEDEIPYALPQGWMWVRMGVIGETNIGLTYSPSDISSSGTPVLRSGNIQHGKIDLTDLVRVKMEVKASVLVQEGDLLICARNGSKALVGKTALINNLQEEMAFGAFMAIFRSPINQYLLLFIHSPLFRKMIDEVNTVTINQITQSNLRSTIFPLPPFIEQQRIVAKVDELMALCDALKARLADAQTTQIHLAGAIVEQAVA